jgi:phage repressor protein C with HTH and peptisase S24 domain
MTKNSRKLPLTDWQVADSDRLKELFQRKKGLLKLTQEMIAAELGEGVTQGAVSHFMNRRTALSLRAASVFAKMLQVPVSDFSPTLAQELEKLSASVEPHRPETAAAPAANDASITEDDLHVYVVQLDARAAAGSGEENPHVEVKGTLAFKKSWIKGKGLKVDSLAVIFASGRSMEPTIYEGDSLLVDKRSTSLKHNRIFAFLNAEKETIVKRAIKDGDDWWLYSDNADKTVKAHRDMAFADDEEQRFDVIGQVIWRGGDL